MPQERPPIEPLPLTPSNVAKANGIILECLESHERWIEFQRDNPHWEEQTSPSMVGDLEHHTTCVEEYRFVLGLLAELRRQQESIEEKLRRYHELVAIERGDRTEAQREELRALAQVIREDQPEGAVSPAVKRLKELIQKHGL